MIKVNDRERIRKWAWGLLNELLNTSWTSESTQFHLGRERVLKDVLHFIRSLELEEMEHTRLLVKDETKATTPGAQ